MAVIKDVAKLAGVSVGTVSKYLNTPEKLKDETRKKVENAIDELQYTPSPLARSMRTGRTNTVAVIVPDIGNPFFAEVYNSIRTELVSKGYIPVLYTTEDNLDMLKSYLVNISLRQIEGLIFCFVEEDEAVENFIAEIQEKMPVVLISWDINHAAFNCISVDVFEGIQKSTSHLISIGHKSIAYVGGHENNSISVQKFSGYLKSMKNAGLEVVSELVFRGDFNLKTGYNAARKFTMYQNMPTAIVAENDILAIGSVKYLLQQKVKIPEDIAVIGFDNIPISSIYEPALSTISLPISRMGNEAVKLFVHKAGNPSAKNKQVILGTELLIRNSTDKNAPVVFEL